MALALAVAAIIAFLAYRWRALDAGGALAATITGAAAVYAGWDWAALLLVFFLSGSALSRWRRAERDRLVGDVVAKADRRDAAQVLANGLVFAAAAMASSIGDAAAWQAIAAGAISAAMADTWSTEIGTVAGGTPRHLVSWRPVPPGTSGGVTLAGSGAALAGALLAGVVVWQLRWDVTPAAVLAGGLAGALLDSLLGATVQERRWCPRCEIATERRIHRCGTSTSLRGGLGAFDNDLVNLTSVLAGGVVTWALA